MAERLALSFLLASALVIVMELLDRFVGGGDDGKDC